MKPIKIYQGNLVNARELHKFLEVKTEFRHWIKRMFEYGFAENLDYFKAVKKDRRQTLKEYYLKISCAKEISMLQRTDKGKEARLYFIQAEESLLKLKQDKRLESFMKLEFSKNKLSNNIQTIGGTHHDFIQIDLEGRKVFFNNTPLDDEVLPDILLKARDLAVATTNEAFNKEDVDLTKVEENHINNHQELRAFLKKNTGLEPEEIPTEHNIKKLDEEL